MIKRNNILLVIIISILIPLFVSCGPSKEEKILMGKWEGMMVETDEDGDEMTFRIVMSFKKDLMNITVAVGYSEVGEIAEITESGDWFADEDEITIIPDEDAVEIRFTPLIKVGAQMLGMSLDELEYLLTSTLKHELGIWEDITIYSLSEEAVTIDFEGSKVTLHKK